MSVPSLSTTELLADVAGIATTLGPVDEQRLWTLIDTLRERATREVFDAAAAWCASAEPALRTVGADVLAHLGWEIDHPFARESEPILLPLLRDRDAGVVAAAAIALGALGAEDTAALCRIAGHPSSDVRIALARSLCELCGPAVVPTLIALTADPDVEVRRLATSGLHGFDREDTEAVRLALVARLRDEDVHTRDEAIFALVQLGDSRAEDALRAAREEPETSELVEMAAMALDSRRHPGRPLPRRH
jgi:HEAT repeat protein